ncbi:MAG: dephospho-CoA kinase [Epsilonproteobacteria bacterium]|nr:dephospho-CoA kinase [Campylobacterota bacterium]
MNAIILTGSIATGKSTVANLLRLYGFSIIDADTIAHEQLQKHAHEIQQIFGSADRKKLREIVFNNKEKRQQLEQFLHPKIKTEILAQAHELEKYSVTYFIDIPLYFEGGNYNEFEKVAVVYTPKDIQLQRLIKRDKITPSQAQQIIDLQMDIDQKAQQATYVIDNSKDLAHLQREVENFINTIK